MKSNSLKGLLEVVLVTENSFTLLAQGGGQLNLVEKNCVTSFMNAPLHLQETGRELRMREFGFQICVL